MLSTQLQNAVIELLSQFISSDFGKLEKLKENQENASMGKTRPEREGEEKRGVTIHDKCQERSFEVKCLCHRHVHILYVFMFHTRLQHVLVACMYY